MTDNMDSMNIQQWALFDQYAPPGGSLRVTVLGEPIFHKPEGTEAEIVRRDNDSGQTRVSVRWPDATREIITIDRIMLGVRLGQLEVIA